jgi:hypothetical protein
MRDIHDHRSLIWKATPLGQADAKPIYFFGTCHGIADYPAIVPRLLQYESIDTLVCELSHKALRSAALQLPKDHAESLAYYREHCMDYRLQDLAEAQNTPIQALDTVADYLHLNEQLNLAAEQVSNVFDLLSNSCDRMKTTVTDYESRDLNALYRSQQSELTESLYDAMVTVRNKRWIAQIQPGQLVAVGAIHLLGPDGLLKAFEEKGYSLEPLENLRQAPQSRQQLDALKNQITSTLQGYIAPLQKKNPLTYLHYFHESVLFFASCAYKGRFKPIKHFRPAREKYLAFSQDYFVRFNEAIDLDALRSVLVDFNKESFRLFKGHDFQPECPQYHNPCSPLLELPLHDAWLTPEEDGFIKMINNVAGHFDLVVDHPATHRNRVERRALMNWLQHGATPHSSEGDSTNIRHPLGY